MAGRCKWQGSKYVWVKYRELNQFGVPTIRDKTFIFIPGGMRITDFPSEDIWRSESVGKVISPQESEAIQAASDRTLGDLFGLRKQFQNDLNQKKRK